MKKLLLPILLLFSYISFGQQTIVNRSTPSVVSVDSRAWFRLNMRMPVCIDTAHGLNGSYDSLGLEIYVPNVGVFFRDTVLSGGHKWTQVGTGSGSGTITNVIAGINMTGGGSSGAVTLNSDTTIGHIKNATQGFVQRNDTLINIPYSTVTASTDFLTIDTTTGKINRFILPPCPIVVDSIKSGTGGSFNVVTTAGYNYNVTTGSSGGTVSTVSVTANNGITQSVSNPTTTPNIILGLGNITPTTVQTNSENYLRQYSATPPPAHGNTLFDSSGIGWRDSTGRTVFLNKALVTVSTIVTDSFPNESGIFVLRKDSGTVFYPYTTNPKNYLTNNQTVTLSGDVTGSGATSIATTITNNAVTYAKMQAVSGSSKLLGSSASGTAVSEITLGTNLSMTGSTLNASGGGGSTYAIAPMQIKGGDSVYQRYTVRFPSTYVAGVTDATPYIINTIDSADANGGGTVIIPVTGKKIIIAAVYNSLCNCQIPIPTHPITDTNRNSIVIEGEVPAPLSLQGGGLAGDTTEGLFNGMVVLYSTLNSYHANSAVFGSALATGSVPNQETVTIQDLAIMVKNNVNGGGAGIGGISFANMTNGNPIHVSVLIDTPVSKSVAQVNNITGITLAPANYNGSYKCTYNYVQGFNKGISISEWADLTGTQILACVYGIWATNGETSNTGTNVGILDCKYSIYGATGGGVCSFQNLSFTIEYQSTGHWYDNVYTLFDSSNSFHGTIYYTMVPFGGGTPNNALFNYSGASNLTMIAYDFGTNVIRGGGLTFTNPTSTNTIAIGFGSSATGVGQRFGMLYNKDGANKYDYSSAYYFKSSIPRDLFDTLGNAWIGANAATSPTLTITSTGLAVKGFANVRKSVTLNSYDSTANNVAGISTTSGGNFDLGDWVGNGMAIRNWVNGVQSLSILSTGSITEPATNTAIGTTGNQTINKPSGIINIASTGTSVVLTNSLISTNSLVFCEIGSHDATATSTQVVTASGSCTIYLNAAATGTVPIFFHVINY